MIPSVTIRADNAFAIPLLAEYATALERMATELKDPVTVALMRRRAGKVREEIDRFEAWGAAYPHRVTMDRTVTVADDTGITDVRRKLKESQKAHDWDIEHFRAVRRELREENLTLKDENERLKVMLVRSRPTQHVTPRPTLP